VHLPSRLSLRLAAFSGSAGRYSDFPTARLLEHTADASYVAAEVELAGTRVRLELAKADPFTLGGRLTVLGDRRVGAALLAAARARLPRRRRGGPEHRPDPRPARRAGDPTRSPCSCAPATAAAAPASCRPSDRPTRASTTTSTSCARSSRRRLLPAPPRAADGRWAVLRFNGQSQATTTFALAEATDDAAAERRARELLPEVEALVDARAAEARGGSEPARASATSWPGTRPSTTRTSAGSRS
jgi:hypothetical protein